MGGGSEETHFVTLREDINSLQDSSANFFFSHELGEQNAQLTHAGHLNTVAKLGLVESHRTCERTGVRRCSFEVGETKARKGISFCRKIRDWMTKSQKSKVRTLFIQYLFHISLVCLLPDLFSGDSALLVSFKSSFQPFL